MKKQILNILMAGMLVLGGSGAWAQVPAPADTPAPAATTAPVEAPVTIPAPDVNVNVAPPAAPQNIDVRVDAPASAPPSTVIIEKGEPSTSTTTNISKTQTTVVQPAVEGAFNPWMALGIGLAVLVVLLFIAMAFSGDRRGSRTAVVTSPGSPSVTTVNRP